MLICIKFLFLVTLGGISWNPIYAGTVPIQLISETTDEVTSDEVMQGLMFYWEGLDYAPKCQIN